MTKEAEHPQHTESALPAGSIPALVTPMHEDGSLDWQSYGALIDWHIEAGTHAIAVMGSTGESATVSMAEHQELIKVAVSHARGRIPVIAGTGANSTNEAIELTRFARDAGATAALSVVPYYNSPRRMACSLTTRQLLKLSTSPSSSTMCLGERLQTFPMRPCSALPRSPTLPVSRTLRGTSAAASCSCAACLRPLQSIAVTILRRPH